MREHNDISRLRLERMTSMWQQRNQAIKDQAKAQERKVAHVLDLARQCGETKETPTERMAMLKIVQNKPVMNFFINSSPQGKMFVIKQYIGVLS
jgi:hypothetical protein